MLNLDPSRTLVGWLVRHGELVNMNIWDGWGDYELSEKGRRSAEKAAQYLSFEKIGRIISSDVPRTMQTAHCIMEACDVSCPEIYCDPNIRPWMVGKFTGETKTAERKADFKHYVENPSEPIPGGESRDQLSQRVQVVGPYLATPYNCLPTVFTTHNSVIKILVGDSGLEHGIDPGGIIAIYMNEKGEFEFEIVLGESDVEES